MQPIADHDRPELRDGQVVPAYAPMVVSDLESGFARGVRRQLLWTRSCSSWLSGPIHAVNDLKHLRVGGRKAYPTEPGDKGFQHQGTPGRPKGLPGVFVFAPMEVPNEPRGLRRPGNDF